MIAVEAPPCANGSTLPYGGGRALEFLVLAADDWETVRDVRLQALRDSPTAYISNYEAAALRTEADWRQTFTDGLWIVAQRGRRIVGLARSLRVHDRPAGERHLESIWVHPRYRRSGVMRAILRHLAELEPEVREWLLWVVDRNVDARMVYERLGFQPTGESQPVDDTSGRMELRLRRQTSPVP